MHRFLVLRRKPLSPLFLGLALGLTACGGGGSTPVAAIPAPTPVSLNGVAAVGDPLVGSTVSARCTTGAAVAPTTTSATGQWTLTLGSAAVLPCAVQVTGGTAGGVANSQVLHSYAAAAGAVNVTPLTDLTVALAAAVPPATWFGALDASHPPAIASTLAAARTQVLQAVSTAGYTLPSATNFDPLTTAFVPAVGDPYDALLDAFARSVAASGISYTQLLTNVLSAAAGGRGISIPTFGLEVPGTGGTGGSGGTGGNGSIVLAAKSAIQAADLASLVGTYTGTFGSSTPTGKAATLADTCGIQVKADGNMSVTVAGKTFGALANGDVGDLILTINTNIAKAIAYDFSTNTNITVEVVRGYVVQATATDNTGALSCTAANPHTTTAGTATTAMVNGATAADINANLVGEYASATCRVSVGANGSIHVVSGTTDVTGKLAGDEQDFVSVFPTIGAEVLSARETSADGRAVDISFSRQAANPSLGLPVTYSADAIQDQPRPRVTLANCQNLVKQ